MRKLIVALAVVVMCGGMTGCGYKTTVNTVSGINVYSSYEEKIPGRFALVVDSQPELLTKKVKASSFTCSAHNFPVALSNTFESSIYEATKSIFEEVATRVTIPSKEEMSKDELSGYILVKATHFEPKVTFIPGFFSGAAFPRRRHRQPFYPRIRCGRSVVRCPSGPPHQLPCRVS